MPPSSDHFIARLWLLFSLSALNVSSAYNLPTILFRLMAQLSNFLISEWGTYTPSLMLADFNLLGHNKSDTYLKPTAYSSWCFDPFSFTIEIVWFQKVSLACTVFTNIRVSSWLCRTLKSLQPLIQADDPKLNSVLPVWYFWYCRSVRSSFFSWLLSQRLIRNMMGWRFSPVVFSKISVESKCSGNNKSGT